MNLDKPSIDVKKLKGYVDMNRSYTLIENGEDVELHFSPEFPEAMSHLPDGEPVTHIMTGKLIEERVYFLRFTTRSAFGETFSDLEGSDDPIMEWLNYI
ncbi:MAG: hypothetical protein ACYDAO_01065 [Thermoplasmataceae archaeon]